MQWQQLKEKTNEIFARLVQIRRHLHENPELSFEEFATSAYIKSILDEEGFLYTGDWVKTGIVCEIQGRNPHKRLIALRADIDALPITEQNKVDYASKNAGIMHACGHDVHTTCLLGVMMILKELKESFEGTVRCIFQPGEEKLPGGAHLMIEQGVLKNPDVELILGQHVFPEMETGKVGFRPGMYMASTDEIHITVNGRGGHAALPHQYDYTTMALADFMTETHRSFEEMKSVHGKTAVLAYGRMIAEGATNVIPARVTAEGTLRTLDEEWRYQVHDMLTHTGKNIAEKYNCVFEVAIKHGYPVLNNDYDLTTFCMNKTREYLGLDKVEMLDLRMTAEDFAFYGKQIPACFYRLGTGNKSKGIISPVHTATFDVDEESLKTGCGVMAMLAIECLNR